MTNADVSLFTPGGSSPLPASGDVSFVDEPRFLTTCQDVYFPRPSRSTSRGSAMGPSTLSVLDTCLKATGAVGVQLCLANGSMMVVNQPEEYSDAEVAKHAVTSKIGRRSAKRFAK